MAILNIITGADNPILRAKAKKVSVFDTSFKKFAKAMKEKMVEADGLGLAAPQVGESIRLIIVTLNYGSPNAVIVPMANPEILEFSEEIEIAEEGCLSLPGQYAKVERPRSIKVRFSDMEGEEYVLSLSGLNARVVQHETDHLNGILFIDRVEGEITMENIKKGAGEKHKSSEL